ncbi:MAG TPA: hypothetical protein VFQ80_16885 [Thermomicrobiales bacterium]|nr:hypothetical protein [Thermomicrobiales bacterium]
MARFRRFERAADGHDQEIDFGAIAEIDVELRVLFKFVDPGKIDAVAVHDVDVAGFDQLPHRRAFFDDADDDPVEMIAVPAAPIIGIAFEHDLLSRLERNELPAARAGALGVDLHPAVAEIVVVGVGKRDFGVDDLRPIGGGHGGDEQRLRRFQVEDDRSRIGRGDLGGVRHEAADDVDGAAAHLQQSLERRFHRRAVARRAVLEFQAGTEFEGPDALIGVGRPRFGHEAFVLIGRAPFEPDQPFVDVANDDGRPIVVLRLRIEVGRRRIEPEDQRRAVAVLASDGGADARRRDQAGQRRRQAGRGGALQQAAPVERSEMGPSAAIVGIHRIRHDTSSVYARPARNGTALPDCLKRRRKINARSRKSARSMEPRSACPRHRAPRRQSGRK